MQDAAVTEKESVQEFRRRRQEEGPVYWAREDFLAVFDPQTAQRLEAANYADLTLLDGFTDTVRGCPSTPVTWNKLRSAWSQQLRNLANPGGLLQLAQRMDAMLAAECGREQDLVWLAERVSVESLVPAILDGLKPGAHRRVLSEILSKVAWVLSDVDTHRSPRWHPMKMVLLQLIAGFEVRRELLGRAKGKRPRQPDLADPVVDMIPELGIGRAVDAVTALLTAITGSPGAAAACMFYELSRRPDWRSRLEEELGAVPLERLCESPTRLAPQTTRFVKEILRIWSSPPVVVRSVRTDLEAGEASLKAGQHYVLSSYLLHHDEKHWPNPEAFDPDRWLAEARREQCPHGSFVPFGWAPKSCIGAGLGMAQLVLLAHLVSTRYRLQVPDPERAKMVAASVVRPADFHGAVHLRAAAAANE